ncbi:MAG: inner membrane protein YhjD [Mycobacteriaceae bacterium]|nr:inner membrane protein YhjD [Mycobacteriaceae bacterium]
MSRWSELRARFDWCDHVVRAYQRFDNCRGTFFAAGLTYYTIFAVLPLLMIGYAVVGFVLSSQRTLLATIDDRIRSAVSSELAQQLVGLMDSAIASRASVGVVGLLTALWAGLSWMWHLREALSQMWGQPVAPIGFVRTKVSDLAALISSFIVALLIIALTVLGNATPMATLLRWLGIQHVSVLHAILSGLSLLVSLLVSWGFFTWVIARLPREPIGLLPSVRAGLLVAIGFELFKQVASIYLRVVLRSPAGVAFGPVLGLMVFAYVTATMILFATAWAATSSECAGPSGV